MIEIHIAVYAKVVYKQHTSQKQHRLVCAHQGLDKHLDVLLHDSLRAEFARAEFARKQAPMQANRTVHTWANTTQIDQRITQKRYRRL